MGRSSTTFAPGPDPRRHQFTRAERRRGWRAAMNHSNIHVAAWVFRRVRGYYRARRRDKFSRDEVGPRG